MEEKSKPKRRIAKIAGLIIVIPLIIVSITIVSLYLPPVQKYIIEKCCEYIAESSGYNLTIGRFRLTFPLDINIEDYTLSQESDTLLHGERLRLSVQLRPLFSGKAEVDYITIEESHIDSHTLIDGVRIEGLIGTLRTSVRSYDIKNNSLTINRLNLTDSHTTITLCDKAEEPDTTKSSPQAWNIALNNGKLENIGIEIRNDSTSYAAHIAESRIENAEAKIEEQAYSIEEFILAGSSFRYDKGETADTLSPTDHLHFDNIHANFKKAAYSPQKSNLTVEQLRFDQKPRGLSLTNATLAATGDSTKYTIKELRISTGNGSSLKADATIPHEIKSGNIITDLTLNLSKKDLQGFLAAETYGKLKQLPDSTLKLTAALRGTMRKMRIDTIDARIPRLAHIAVSGEASNITERNRSADIYINGTADNLHKFLYSNALPDTFRQEALYLRSKLTLNGGEYSTVASLTSGKGTIEIKAMYDEKEESYEATARAKDFSLSKLLPEIPLHDANLILTAEGKGFDILSPETDYRYTLLLDTLTYDSLTFNSITLNAGQTKGVSDIHLLSTGKGMEITMFAHTLLKDSTVENTTDIELKNVELQRLAATRSPARATMKLAIKATTDLKDKYSLNIIGENMRIAHGGKEYTPARLDLTASTAEDSTRLHLTNGDLSINGYMAAGYGTILRSIETTVAEIQKAIQSGDTLLDIRRYERMLPETSLDIKAKEKNILAGILSMQGITYKELNLKFNIDTLKGINSRASIHHFERGEIHFDTLRAALSQEQERLRYFAGIRSRAMREKNEKATFGAFLYGALQDNELTANYVFRDNKDAPGMRIGVTAKMTGEGYRFRFNPDAILFRHPFTFNAYNTIELTKRLKIRGNIDLRDSTDSGATLIATTDSADNQELSLELHSIDLEAVTRMLPFAPNLSGTVNADLHYRESGKGLLLGGDIQSTDLAYEGTLIGNESLELSYIPINDKEQHSYAALLHNGTQVAQMTGIYNSDSTRQQNMGELTLTRLPVSLANAFLKESNITTKGYLDGVMTISRENNRTITDGHIQFDSVYADLPQFGTSLHLVDDKVEIKESKLQFRDFSIYAKGNTPFAINGTIDLSTLPDAIFDLRMRADNYEIINAKRQKGAMFYGRMFVNLNSRITGPISSLKVGGNGTILGKSYFTYVLQETPLETANDLDGLITFTNFKDTTRTKPSTAAEYNFGNIEMNLSLHIEEGARINADFDEERNSYIKLQGEGNLNLTYNRESDMNLTGRYTLSSGEMKYTLPIIPLKTFNIAQGSNITWTGDIMNPTLDITATERVTSSVTIDNNTQATAFDVGVKLTNTLDNMGLGFTLTAPENAAVQNQLNSVDAETLNKYALTMLITGVYTGGDNSLNVSNALSSYLDAQINNIVGNAMSSTMDINVGITDVENSDTGDKYKNYSFSFTKRFWNDRLTVIVGGEVNNNEHATGNESFINNVSLEWKISNSGNRYLRLFYDKNYESILEGEITEAGVGYIYKRKMNNLNELLIFRRKEE